MVSASLLYGCGDLYVGASGRLLVPVKVYNPAACSENSGCTSTPVCGIPCLLLQMILHLFYPGSRHKESDNLEMRSSHEGSDLSQRAGQRLCSSRRSELCLPVPFALISRTFWRPLKSMIILCDFGTVIIFASSDPAPL